MEDKILVVLVSDKNLGPAIMDRVTYIRGMLDEHLLDGETYRQLDASEAKNIRHKFLTKGKELLYDYESDLLFNEKQFFKRGFG